MLSFSLVIRIRPFVSCKMGFSFLQFAFLPSRSLSPSPSLSFICVFLCLNRCGPALSLCVYVSYLSVYIPAYLSVCLCVYLPLYATVVAYRSPQGGSVGGLQLCLCCMLLRASAIGGSEGQLHCVESERSRRRYIGK